MCNLGKAYLMHNRLYYTKRGFLMLAMLIYILAAVVCDRDHLGALIRNIVML